MIFTVLFARLLGAEDYGSLAALVSTFVILAVPGVGRAGRGRARDRARAARRRAAAGRDAARLATTAARASAWRSPRPRSLLREPIADLISVPEAWAAAATAPTGVLWLLLSVERGALQGVHAYKPVAWSIVLEAFGRLVFGLVLVAPGWA